MRALLWPHAMATEAYYHISLHYQSGVGYVAAGGGFAIGPACMGMNFIVMLFCLMVCAFTRRFRGIRKAAFFMLALAGSVATGVIVSCIRIIGSVPFLSMDQFTAIHSGVGIALYLAALAGSYILVNKATGGFHEKHR
jgi:exosortase K